MNDIIHGGDLVTNVEQPRFVSDDCKKGLDLLVTIVEQPRFVSDDCKKA